MSLSSTSRTSEASDSSSLRTPSACCGFIGWPGLPVGRHSDAHDAFDLAGEPHGRGAEVVLGTGVVERAFLQPGDQQPSEQQVLVHPERGKQCGKFEAVGGGACGRERLQQLEGGADARRLGLGFEFGGLHSVRYHTPLS